MKNLNNILLTVFVASALGATALAGEYSANEKVEAILEKFDSNQDDIITQEEAGKFWKRLARADLNKDGEVTKEEMLEAWGEEPPRPEPGPGPRPRV
jgi:Ca2+-binding EF-hand superfamily protein